MVVFVGAGAGDPELITVKGKEYLKKADCIIYAGSLVNPELLKYAGENTTVYDSAKMTLEEVISVMERYRNGLVIRLHTGDPSLYGAIREQMEQLDILGIEHHSVPGVSSFLAAAASLDAEYTLPEVSQSLIITRAEGRTPVPAGQQLHVLAATGASLAIFLSASLTEKVKTELLSGGLSPDTPVAIVYKASWPDEKIIKCTIDTLPEAAEAEGIEKTALILVGDFLQGAGGRSKLYHPDFTTMYRSGNKKRKLSIAAFTDKGYELGKKIAEALRNSYAVKNKAGCSIGDRTDSEGRNPDYITCDRIERGGLSKWTQSMFYESEAIVFVGAAGIAVRAISAFPRSKTSDPAVVVVDEDGKYAIPILSEEYGGANRIAQEIAGITEAQAVITSRQGKKNEKRYVTVGIGCKRGTSYEDIEKAYETFIRDNDIPYDEVSAFASINLKKDEEGLLEFADKKGIPIAFYSPEELMEVRGEFESSDFVMKITGCDNVCERAAVKLAGEAVSVHKTAYDGVTLAAVYGVIAPVSEKK